MLITTELTKDTMSLNLLDASTSLERGDYVRVERCLNNIRDILMSDEYFEHVPIRVLSGELKLVARCIVKYLREKKGK